MELFRIVRNEIISITTRPFKLEKDIQGLIEANSEKLFELEFIHSELTVDKYRIDTLCYDPENNSFVIIEYKKGSSYSVIDQGYTYLQLLLNNKSEFILALSQNKNKVYRKEDIDWSQTRIIFISPSFNSYQKDSVNFKNIPFELYEIKRYSGDLISLVKHKTTSTESIDSLSKIGADTVISNVSKEVKVYEEEDHTNGRPVELIEKWEQLKDRLNELDDVEIIPKRAYISIITNNKAIAYVSFRKTSLQIEIVRGNINPDGSKSKNFFTIDDPKHISESKSSTRKTGITGVVYKIPFDKKSDIDYLMFLIKQKYKQLVG